MATNFEKFKEQIDNALEIIDQSGKVQLGAHAPEDTFGAPLPDTTSLLERCDELVRQYEESSKPTIRVLHSLPCCGGGQVADILTAFPNTFVISDVHPEPPIYTYNFYSDITSQAVQSGLPVSQSVITGLFIENMRAISLSATKQGLSLVLRDNTALDYLYAEKAPSKSLVRVLEREFSVESVLLLRDPIDAYASLVKNEFFGCLEVSFNEFCSRYLSFVEDYADARTIQWESIGDDSKGWIHELHSAFNLNVPVFCGLDVKAKSISKNDPWRPSSDDNFNSGLSTAPSTEEIEKSDQYFLLQKALKPKEKKLILIASMPRSGSTWLFNCVREIYKELGVEFYSCWVEDYDPGRGEAIHIVKLHNPELRFSSRADLILSSRRDVREVAASLLRMGWLENQEESIYDQIAYLVNRVHPFWFQRSAYELEFKQIAIDPVSEVTRIAKVLVGDRPVDAVGIAEYLERMSAPDRYDRDTQLHPNHRSSHPTKCTSVIERSVLHRVDSHFNGLLREFSYN